MNSFAVPACRKSQLECIRLPRTPRIAAMRADSDEIRIDSNIPDNNWESE